jgi:hypothetical protein
MKNLILELMSNFSTPLVGDIEKLHKGKVVNLTKPSARAVKAAEARKDDQRGTGPTLESALQSAIDGGVRTKVPRLPDVNMFRLRIKGFNPLLASANIMTRLGSDKAKQAYRNKRNNRYLAYMTLRLINNRENPDRFWTIAVALIQKSNCFMV